MGSVKTFEELKKEISKDWRTLGKWRECAEDDFAFVAGHQWTDLETAKLNEQQRAAIVFNRCAPIIASVAGSEINNRTEVRFIPREIGDIKPNEVLSAGAEWFRDQSDAEDHESLAFEDMLTCGLGWTETTLDFEEDQEGAPKISRIDPTEMGWDANAHEKGLEDKSRVFRVRRMPLADARDMFDDKDDWELNADWLSVGKLGGVEHDIPGDDYDNAKDFTNDDTGMVTIVQAQCRSRVKVVEYINPETGKRAEMPKKKFAAIIKKVPLNIPNREVSKMVWYQYFLGKSGILRENQPNPDGSTFHAMTGRWDMREKQFYGLLRSMRDPQKFANKWLSQTLHIINTNAKGGVMVESGAVDDPSEFEESWAASDAVSWLKTGGLSKVKEKGGPQMPAALMALTEFAISSIRDVSGVSMELMGMREANQPGVLEYQRRQSSMTTLAGYFDSLRYYRKRQGDTILHFLRKHIAPTGRLVRMLKEGQEQYVPLAMDDDARKYDVIVDDAPSAPNEKEKAWSVIEAMMPMLQQAGLSLEDWADVLEYSPLPSSFVDKVREKAEEAKQKPNPQQQMQEQLAQLQMQKEQSELVENNAAAELDKAKTQQVLVETALAPQVAAQDAAENSVRVNI